jgi:hypothetical protein
MRGAAIIALVLLALPTFRGRTGSNEGGNAMPRRLAWPKRLVDTARVAGA